MPKSKSTLAGAVGGLIGLGLSVLAPSPALADVVEMNQGPVYDVDYEDAMRLGRGVGFRADEAFTILSVGLDMGRVGNRAYERNATYVFDLWSSPDGNNPGAVLATASFTLAPDTFFQVGYRDAALNYAVEAGEFYILNFRRQDSQDLGLISTHYTWEEDGGESGLIDYGVLTVTGGFEGAVPDPGNPLLPGMRIGFEQTAAVPETPVPPGPAAPAGPKA